MKRFRRDPQGNAQGTIGSSLPAIPVTVGIVLVFGLDDRILLIDQGVQLLFSLFHV